MLRYPDLYHTCYALAGLSVAQTYSKRRQTDDLAPESAVTIRNQSFIVGGEESALVCLPAEFFGNTKYLFFYYSGGNSSILQYLPAILQLCSRIFLL